VIIYAGTIIVLFVFVVMILNLGRESVEQEKRWLRPTTLIGPVLLTAVLLGEVIYLLVRNTSTLSGVGAIQPHELGSALFGPYLLGVELASMVLLAGLIGAYHLGRRYRRDEMEERRDELAE
jgi:NADH-quinone oxidoreductase subunit J